MFLVSFLTALWSIDYDNSGNIFYIDLHAKNVRDALTLANYVLITLDLRASN